MKLRYLVLITAWLLAKLPSTQRAKKNNTEYWKMSLSAYGKKCGTTQYMAALALWLIVGVVIKALVF